MDRLPVYVDFDLTISPQHGFSSAPKDEVVKSINTLHTKYKIIIYSTRANKDICQDTHSLALEDYLTKHNVKYDEICKDKPLFVGVIDDRSYNPTKESWDFITSDLMSKS